MTEDVRAAAGRMYAAFNARDSMHGVPGGRPATMLEMFRVRDGRIAELWGLSSPRRDS
ncbi:hypothetical protein [Nonomuraea zeae]|uniref:hypothetical protein n=1 Tax=Nonomuraea zeae TaxID=1642303 RepID=UPI0014790730|nr:hypothetical protein [Nonomuraea zeae]